MRSSCWSSCGARCRRRWPRATRARCTGRRCWPTPPRCWRIPTFAPGRCWSRPPTADCSRCSRLSSFAYIEVLGLTPAQYGLAMASGSLSYLGGTFFCRRWLLRVGLLGAVQRGAFFTLAGGTGHAAVRAAAVIGQRAAGAGCAMPVRVRPRHPSALRPDRRGRSLPADGRRRLGAGRLPAGVDRLRQSACGSARRWTARCAPMGLGIAFWGRGHRAGGWTLVQRHGGR